jgi:uncharacterized protein
MRVSMLLGLALLVPLCAGCADAPAPPGRQGPSARIDGHRFTIEVADTDASRERGLMDRKSMPPDHGMLFVFPDSEPRTFWMKDTLIPLDMLFFDNRRRLVTLISDAPPCTADPCRIYPSNAPARYVLELNAGTAAKFGIREGDVLAFSGISAPTQ